MTLAFSVPVWGQAYVRLFLHTALPTLLSPGNLPGLSNPAASRFHLYTRPEDEAMLRTSASFRQLIDLMPVEIHLIHEPITVAHHTMSVYHAHTMRIADEAGIPAVFLPPDCVFSDGSMIRVEQLAESGVSVVYNTGLRTDRDRMTALLANHRVSGGSSIAIDGRTLVRYMINCTHDTAKLHFWQEHLDAGLMPANLYWTVDGEGLLARCFHLHPLMVRSQRLFARFYGTIDHDLVPAACPDSSRDYVVADSDELHMVELSGPEHLLYYRNHKGSLGEAAAWAEFNANLRHRKLIAAEIRLHCISIDPVKWLPVEVRARQVVDSILRILATPTLLVGLRYPMVLAWRLYHALLRGRSSPSPVLRLLLAPLFASLRAIRRNPTVH